MFASIINSGKFQTQTMDILNEIDSLPITDTCKYEVLMDIIKGYDAIPQITEIPDPQLTDVGFSSLKNETDSNVSMPQLETLTVDESKNE